MIKLLKGIFGSVDGYALLGFEAVPVGPITGTIDVSGQVNEGGLSFGAAVFGSR
jgi:hypothetical protein